MKYLIPFLLAFCMLLGGCTVVPTPTDAPQPDTMPTVNTTEPATTQEPVPTQESIPTQKPASHLLQTAIYLESSYEDFDTIHCWGDYGYEQNLVWCALPIRNLQLLAIDSEDAQNWVTDGITLYHLDTLNPGEAVNLNIMVPEGMSNRALAYECEGKSYTYGIGYNGRDGGISLFPIDLAIRSTPEETAPPTENHEAFPAVIYTVTDKDGGAKLLRTEAAAQSNSAWHVWKLLKEHNTLIPGGAYLNSFEIDGDTGYLDLAEGIYAANVGSEYELFLIISIANTFIETYDLDDLYLSVNGEIYSGGHVEFEDPFTLQNP